jgi:hypothetical protein
MEMGVKSFEVVGQNALYVRRRRAGAGSTRRVDLIQVFDLVLKMQCGAEREKLVGVCAIMTVATGQVSDDILQPCTLLERPRGLSLCYRA